jgi:hypothetical protein
VRCRCVTVKAVLWFRASVALAAMMGQGSMGAERRIAFTKKGTTRWLEGGLKRRGGHGYRSGRRLVLLMPGCQPHRSSAASTFTTNDRMLPL